MSRVLSRLGRQLRQQLREIKIRRSMLLSIRQQALVEPTEQVGRGGRRSTVGRRLVLVCSESRQRLAGDDRTRRQARVRPVRNSTLRAWFSLLRFYARRSRGATSKGGAPGWEVRAIVCACGTRGCVRL